MASFQYGSYKDTIKNEIQPYPAPFICSGYTNQARQHCNAAAPVMMVSGRMGSPPPDYSFLSVPNSSLMPPMDPSRLVAS